MTGKGHHIAAAGVAAGLFFWGAQLTTFSNAIHLALGCLIGGKAPDWLELPLWNGQARIIPHRRVTHWVFGWILILGASTLLTAPAGLAVTGFAIGSLVHLLGDMMTPMGVPVLHPWNRTPGAKPRSPGLTELLFVGAIWALSIVPYWIYVKP